MLETILKNQFRVGDQKGFTFIELISMMVIMSMMVSVAIKKLDLISDSASITALQSGIRELNTRETVAWAKIKLNDSGYTIDADVYNTVDKIISRDYSWNPGPDISGGRLHFKSRFVDLNRTPSTATSVGSWH